MATTTMGLQVTAAVGLEAEDTLGAAAVAIGSGVGLETPHPIRMLPDTAWHHRIPSHTLPSRLGQRGMQP
jgi:hypothetical protein